MRRTWALIFALGLLAGCGEEPQDAANKAEYAPVAKFSAAAPASHLSPPQAKGQEVETAPTQEEVTKGEGVLDWHNRVQELVARGTLADRVATCAALYRETWQLPKRPTGSWVRELAPPTGLVRGDEAALVETLLATMDKASDAMLRTYGKLESYVADGTIQDDGERGRQLVQEVGASYDRYLGARKSFLALVESRAQEAERVLLLAHPLERQIRAAQGIFSQFREIGDLLATENPAPQLLEACGENIRQWLHEGSRPPFPASPGYERLYRQFLRAVQRYLDIFQRARTEGFHGLQQRELLASQAQCRRDYNAFAAAVNGDGGQMQ